MLTITSAKIFLQEGESRLKSNGINGQQLRHSSAIRLKTVLNLQLFETSQALKSTTTDYFDAVVLQQSETRQSLILSTWTFENVLEMAISR